LSLLLTVVSSGQSNQKIRRTNYAPGDGMSLGHQRVGVLMTLVLCFLGPASWGQGADKSERILFNAKVFTGIAGSSPMPRPLLFAGTRLWPSAASPKSCKPQEKTQNVSIWEEKPLLPGLIDSHIHAVEGGLTLTSARCG